MGNPAGKAEDKGSGDERSREAPWANGSIGLDLDRLRNPVFAGRNDPSFSAPVIYPVRGQAVHDCVLIRGIGPGIFRVQIKETQFLPRNLGPVVRFAGNKLLQAGLRIPGPIDRIIFLTAFPAKTKGQKDFVLCRSAK